MSFTCSLSIRKGVVSSKGTVVTVLIGISVCVLLAVLLETWSPLQKFRTAHPNVARFIPLAGLVAVVLTAGALLRPRTRCSKCGRTYSDFAVDYNAGTIRCLGCGNTVDIVEELGREQAVFILDGMLKKADLAADHRSQIENLKSRIDAA